MRYVQLDPRIERENRFIGRKTELSILSEWLADPTAPFTLISINGTGRIGKSSLMAEMLRRAREQGSNGIWLPSLFINRCGNGHNYKGRKTVPATTYSGSLT